MMKKMVTVIAMLLVAALSLGNITAFAAEVPQDGTPFRMMRNAEDGKKAELTDEQKAALQEKFKDGSFKPGTASADGKTFIGKPEERPELTGEQKAALVEKIKDSLSRKLAADEITQEKYDEAIARIESGDFAFAGKGFKGMIGKRPENAGNFKPGERPELTEEQKEALKEKTGDDFPASKLKLPEKGIFGRGNKASDPTAEGE